MADEPDSAGAFHVTIAAASPAVAAASRGADGGTLGLGPGLEPEGVTALDDAEGPHPEALRARTANVYEVPLDRPVTVHVSVGAVAVQTAPPGLAVTS